VRWGGIAARPISEHIDPHEVDNMLKEHHTSGQQIVSRLKAARVFQYSIGHQGGTFNEHGEPVSTGIAVSVQSLVFVKHLTRRTIERAITVVGDHMYLGTWWDMETGMWEVSETVCFSRLPDALRIAGLLRERYLFDIDRDQTIAVV
jgi:hypothetical protein